MNEIVRCLFQVVFDRDLRKWDVMWKESNCVTDSTRPGTRKVASDTPVMVHCRADVPTQFTIQFPGASLACIHLGNDFGSWRSQWGCCKIKSATEVLVGRELGISRAFLNMFRVISA